MSERPRRVESWALREVSLTVAPGESVAIVGANGSGKSTLLRIAAGVTKPTTGSITVQGRLGGLLTLGEGFHPMLTGVENALTGGILAGLRARDARRRIGQIAEFSGLGDDMDEPLRTYSSGMRLRLAFAVAIHVDPDVLLIDEVLAVGDLAFHERCVQRLEHLQAQGVAILLASHSMGELERLCTRAIWLVDGSPHAVGHAGEVIERYRQDMSLRTPKPDPGDAGARTGSGEVSITGVVLRGGSLDRTDRIAAGQGLSVAIDYDVNTAVSGVVFCVSAHTRDGQKCFDLSTTVTGAGTSAPVGPGSITLVIDRLDLAAGHYALDVGAFAADWSRAYDYRWHAYPLEVQGEASAGPLTPPHRWSIS